MAHTLNLKKDRRDQKNQKRENQLLDRIEALGAVQFAAIPHSRKSFREHLLNTAKILRAWGAERDVCCAGLCHSIYGTEFFRRQLVDLGLRAEVKEILGPRAENLAYWFSAAERESLYWDLNLLHSPDAESNIFDRLEKKSVLISKQDHLDLLTIAAANLLEQLPGDYSPQQRSVRAVVQSVDVLPAHLAHAVRQSWRWAFEKMV